ncbi:MAG: HAD family hydrolase [Pelosinus sp.]|nr:HAD family hydrolase [Pelosinus sp.]
MKGKMFVAAKILYISDLDGTLLNSSKEVSCYSRETINALLASGLNFSVATARTAATATQIVRGLNINIPAILMNGAAIYDIENTKYIKTEKIPREAAYTIFEVMRKHNTTGFMYALADNKLKAYYEVLKTPALTDYYNERVTKFNKTFQQLDRFSSIFNEQEIIYFTLMDTRCQLEALAGDLKEVPGIDLVISSDVYVKSLWYLEIHGKNASKYNALNYIRDYCGFERIIGFGDNLNDLPLLNACDEFYAVANALDELKEKATGVIGANNSDAVAKFLALAKLDTQNYSREHGN